MNVSRIATWRWALIAVIVAVGAFVVLAVVIDRQNSGDPAPIGKDDLTAFRDYPVFWVGEQFGGYALDRVFQPDPDAWQQPWIVTYGDCGDAFETGCVPPLVIKTSPQCLHEFGEESRIRDRPTWYIPHLTMETGAGTVTIYAASGFDFAAANALVVANDAVIDGNDVIPPGPLPGSGCEFARLQPRVAPSRETPNPFTPDPKAATVVSSFGDFDTVNSLAEAEERLGARVVRSHDPRFSVTGLSLAGIRRFKNPLPRLEQMRYSMVGHRYDIVISEAPESYPDIDDKDAPTSMERIGDWDVQMRRGGDYVKASFYSGDSVEGQRIRVSVVGIRGYDLEELREFVATLTLGD